LKDCYNFRVKGLHNNKQLAGNGVSVSQMNQNGLASAGALRRAGVEFVSRRNCSIGPRPLIAVFASLVALSIGFGIAFAVAGPWLVLPFAGLEMLVVGLAFVACGRHAGDFERIRVDPLAVTVEQVAGQCRTVHEFNPRWARLTVAHRATGVRLMLSQSGNHVELGGHLGFERRQAFAAEFGAALREAARA
jgi:uncharacterized membrane protein